LQTGKIRKKTIWQTIRMGPLLTTGCFFLLFLWGACAWGKTDVPSLSTWFVDMNQYAASAHGTLTCEDCHGTMMDKGKIHPDPDTADFLKTQTKRDFDYQACQKCHKTAYTRFLQGEHAKAAVKEKTTGKASETGFAPTCGDCHSAHYARSHLSRSQTGKMMTESCGSCHPEQKKTFLANYHGKAAVNLGYDKAAFCTDCHGAHTTLSLKDKEAALNACLRCHKDAPPEFANIIIHDSTKDLDLKNDTKKSGLRWVHWLGTMSFVFVVVVLVFFYTHTGLLMLRKLHEKLRRHK